MSQRKFTERGNYLLSTEEFKTLLQLDNWSEQGFYYGRTNFKGRIIAPVDISTMSHLNDEQVSFNFVVDAFNDFRNHYKEKVVSGMTPVGDQKTFDPPKAYIKPLSLYYEHQSRLQSIVLEKYLIPDKDNIVNFEDFIVRFNRFIQDYAPRYPILYSSFVGSSICPMHSTGLMIELWDVAHDSDEQRDSIVDSEHFYIYSEMAKEYGFVIPRHAPWCIFANLDSTIMQQYAIQYDALDREQIMNEYYYECKDHDIDLMKAMLFSVYDRFAELCPTIEKLRTCENGKLVSSIRPRPSHDSRELSSVYDPSYWLRMYVEILLREKNMNFSKQLLDIMMKDCYYMFNTYGFDAAYTFIEMKIIKTKKDLIR